MLRGYARRFWQGSRDHRGTPQAPGRVVTLIRAPEAECVGVALRVDAAVLAHLDHREKDGYERVDVDIRTASGPVRGITYIAPAGNPGYLGPAPLAAIAAHIRRSAGPSGTNREYVRELAVALAQLGAEDAHVSGLHAQLEAAEPRVGTCAPPVAAPSKRRSAGAGR